MSEPVTKVCRTLELAGVRYCILRDANRLTEPAGGGDVDILVDAADLVRTVGLLERAGYVRLPAWGHAPHHFFVGYDACADRWTKLDVVTAVAYGRRVHAMVTGLGDDCLTRRRHDGVCFVPCPEDELLMLVLHCVIDKGAFQDRRSARIQDLLSAVTDEARLEQHLSDYWPGMRWPALAASIEQGDWASLIAQRLALARHLRRRAPLQTAGRSARDWLLRKCGRLVGLARPTTPSVAFLAPDGAGKSTLVAGIQEHFFQPVHSVYMGRPKRTAGAPGFQAPGLGFSRQIFSLWRLYLRARYRQAGGQLVVFDRYTYDALLPAAGSPTRLTRLRRWLLAHACPAPGLLVVLDAPGDVLFARKREHTAAILERQRQAYLAICARLPRTAVVDVTRDAATVRRQVAGLLWSEYRRRARRGPGDRGHDEEPVPEPRATLEVS